MLRETLFDEDLAGTGCGQPAGLDAYVVHSRLAAFRNRDQAADHWFLFSTEG